MATLVTTHSIREKMPIVDVEIIECLQGFQENSLPPMLASWSFDNGGKVFRSNEHCTGLEQMLDSYGLRFGQYDNG